MRVHLVDADAAHPYLNDGTGLDDAAHDAGVIVGRVEVFVAQVGVSVDGEHRQAGEVPGVGAHGADADGVLAAEGDHELAVVQEFGHDRLYALRHRLRTAAMRRHAG